VPLKLTDANVAEIRRLAGEGVPAGELARRFAVSRRHVGRLLRGEQRQQIGGLDRETARGSVAAAVERLVDGLELDAAGEVLAATASVIAAKLDALRASDSAAAAAAAPGLARQVVDLTALLKGDAEEPDALDDLVRRREARLLAARVEWRARR